MAEGAERLEISLKGHQIESGAKLDGMRLAFEREKVGDQIVDLVLGEIDVGVAKKRRKIVGIRSEPRVLEVDHVQVAFRQHEIPTVIVAMAEHAGF